MTDGVVTRARKRRGGVAGENVPAPVTVSTEEDGNPPTGPPAAADGMVTRAKTKRGDSAGGSGGLATGTLAIGEDEEAAEARKARERARDAARMARMAKFEAQRERNRARDRARLAAMSKEEREAKKAQDRARWHARQRARRAEPSSGGEEARRARQRRAATQRLQVQARVAAQRAAAQARRRAKRGKRKLPPSEEREVEEVSGQPCRNAGYNASATAVAQPDKVGDGWGILTREWEDGEVGAAAEKCAAKTNAEAEIRLAVSKTSIEVFNHFSKLDAEYAVQAQAMGQLQTALAKVQASQTEDPETLAKIEGALAATAAKIEGISAEYDLVGAGMAALGVVGELVEKAVVEVGKLSEEHRLSEKALAALTSTLGAVGSPTPARSAFMCYSEARGRAISESRGPDGDKGHFDEVVAREWRGLSKQDKAYWEDMEKKEKIRFADQKKNSLAPKRPTKAFLMYAQQRWRLLQQANPDLPLADISRLLGELWQNASPTEKRRFLEQEEREHRAYEAWKNDEKPARSMNSLAKQDKAYREELEKRKKAKAYQEELERKEKTRFANEKKAYKAAMVQKLHAKEDHLAPKRPKSAFVMYKQLRMGPLQQENPDMNIVDISRLLREMWQNASPVEKRPFLERQERERRVYEAEMAAWKSLPKQDSLVPKRPKSAFFMYKQQWRGPLQRENQDMKIVDISRLLGEMWQNASPVEKRPFLEREERERRVYKAKTAAWKSLSKQDRAYLEDVEKKEETRFASAHKGSFMAKKNPLAPKRVINAYLWYAQQQRGHLQRENLDMTSADISHLIGEMWRHASPAEKRPFLEREEQEWRAYKARVAAWKNDEKLAPSLKSPPAARAVEGGGVSVAKHTSSDALGKTTANP